MLAATPAWSVTSVNLPWPSLRYRWLWGGFSGCCFSGKGCTPASSGLPLVTYRSGSPSLLKSNHTHPPPVPSSSEPNFWAPKLWVKLMPEAAVASSNRIVLAGVACANRAHESAKTLNIRTSTSGLLYGIAGLSRLDRQALWISPAPQAPHFLARAPVRYGSQ